MHVEALFTLDARGRLVTVNEPSGKPAPRFFLGRTAEGNGWWFRHDVSATTVRNLQALCRALPAGMAAGQPPDGFLAPFVAVLEREAPVTKIWQGPAFRFPDRLPESTQAVAISSANGDLLLPLLDSWHGDVERCQPMYAMVVGGLAVSLCASVRIAPAAHEAGVETAPEFRGLNYAGQAVAAWARAVRRLGARPLYSTSWSNAASRSVARKIGLIEFGVDYHVT
jgi:hypothetical protein